MSRLFIFIDESGDAGIHTNSTSSSYYQLNVMVASREQLGKIALEFSRFRYFTSADKEIDKYLRGEKTRKIIRDIYEKITLNNDVNLFIFRVEKRKYIGPYYEPLESKKLRNFIIRIALEKVYHEMFHNDILPESVEVVIDRFLDKPSDQQNLELYLKGNYNLPRILHVTQIDSEYSEHMQCTDVLGKLVKKHIENGGQHSDLGFVKCIDITHGKK